ncbi:hypothetical protein [Kitasatospora sp. NPDC093558]|uniref:hypothetical protein n=1 Tax=Kitasatospora sp. NPDC093558 TaxID=3155201 RepID=UPI00342366CD
MTVDRAVDGGTADTGAGAGTDPVAGVGLGAVLDPVQLNRIEALHRGFRYQHLYAVACVLTMPDTGARVLVTERDEDIELVLPGRRVYVQVKTRTGPLGWTDVRGAVEGFAAIRAEHAARRREGEPILLVVANTAPGPGLATRIAGPDWPADIRVQWPGAAALPGLPPAWPGLDEAVGWCEEAAARVPFGSLAPRTLVAKLAAHLQHVATGAGGHRVSADELPSLLEQFVQQLQDFPAAPEPWYPQRDEPPAEREDRLRLIVGLAGAGKSSWAGRAAAHCAGTVVYFDVGDLASASVPSSLARELSARLLATAGHPAEAAVLPSGSALELLAAVDRGLVRDERVTVMLDNAHRLDHPDLRALLEAASRVRFVLLARPWEGQRPLEAYLGISGEALHGWDEDTVAAVFTRAGCALDHPTAQAVLELTGGLPMFVANAAQLTRDAFGADARAFCAALRDRLHLTPTVQEILIGDVFGRLGDTARVVAAGLAVAEVPLTAAEASALTGALTGALTTVTAAARAGALRELVLRGVAQTFADGRVKLHDAARLAAGGEAEQLRPDRLDAARRVLSELLQDDLNRIRDVRRFGRWLRLQADLGRVDVLVEIAGDEFFREIGFPAELRAVLEAVAADPGQSTGHRFRAANALATWCHDLGDRDGLLAGVERLRSLAAGGDLDAYERGTLALRLLNTAGLRGDAKALRGAYQEALSLADTAQAVRIVRYTYATGLLELGRHEEAAAEAFGVGTAYFDHLGLEPDDVLGASAAEIRALVAPVDSWLDDCKHVADCLFLYVCCCRHLNRPYGLAALHAMKFYEVSGAWRSLVTVGQDAVDDLVEAGALEDALELIDRHLLPLTGHFALFGEVIGLRSQRAVLTAWLGDPQAALAQLDALEQYDLTGGQARDIRSQRQLVEAIGGPEGPMTGDPRRPA